MPSEPAAADAPAAAASLPQRAPKDPGAGLGAHEEEAILAELEAILNSDESSPYAVLGPGKAKLTSQEMEAVLTCPLPHNTGGGCAEVVSLKDLRARLGYWLDVAASGRTLVLIRKGQAMAVLGGVPEGTKVISG